MNNVRYFTPNNKTHPAFGGALIAAESAGVRVVALDCEVTPNRLTVGYWGDKMRLFFAINFSDATKSKLVALRDEIRIKSIHGNFPAADNLHLTLSFLGECDFKQIIAAKTVLDSLTVEPMDICVDRLGRFHRDSSDIWWAGLAENKTLITLQQELTDKLISAGFRLENRKYSPHITLAREVVTDIQPWKIEPFGETVCLVELMKSERIQGKLTYIAIHSKQYQNEE